MKYIYSLLTSLFSILSISAPAAIAQQLHPFYNFAYLAVAKAHDVHLIYSGITVQHLRLGNYMATREGRTGSLRFEVDLVRRTSPDQPAGFMLVTEKRFYINGQQLGKKRVYIDGRLLGDDPYVGGFPSLYNYAILSNGSYSKMLDIGTLVDSVSADKPFHDEWTDDSLKHQSVVQPNAGVMTVLGRQTNVARFTATTYWRKDGHLIDQEDAWVNDSIPGRIVRLNKQAYLDDGSPGNRCDFTLVEARVR